MTKLHELANLGQSIWYDNIRRALLDSGELQALVEAGVTGVTSNPSIFEKAIAGSADYDEALGELVTEGKVGGTRSMRRWPWRISGALLTCCDRCTIGPVAATAMSAWRSAPSWPTTPRARSPMRGGSLPLLDRPNVMIKVPATPAGIPAIETLIGEGINVNVTLMFSLAHYDAVAEAYIAGLEKLAAAGGDLSRVASVASFFVSRVDTAVDRALEALESNRQPPDGKIAIANAKVAYARFREVFSGERWERLAAQGARVQRPLWASTGTKNPLYPDTLYVDALIGPDTVNTVPPATLNAFLDHGTVALTLERGLEEARDQLARLADLGVDLEAITQRIAGRGRGFLCQGL